jgi:hypothetical protein
MSSDQKMVNDKSASAGRTGAAGVRVEPDEVERALPQMKKHAADG